MTFSIVARSPDGAQFGVAVASKFLSVGAMVPAAEPGGGYGGSDVLIGLHDLDFGRPDPARCSTSTATWPSGRRATGRARPPDPSLDDAPAGWAGVEDLEDRLVPGKIDPVVLTQLRTRSTPATGSN